MIYCKRLKVGLNEYKCAFVLKRKAEMFKEEEQQCNERLWNYLVEAAVLRR